MKPNPILFFKFRKGLGIFLKWFILIWIFVVFECVSPFSVFAQPATNETEKQIFEEGRRLMDLGDLDGAIASFQDVLLVNPLHTPSHLVLGLIYGRKGQLNTAIESLKQAVEIDPNLLAGYLLLGQMYTRKKLPDQAKRAYERVIAIQPDYAGGYYLLGQIHQSEGNEIEAAELYRMAISSKEDSPEKKQAQAALEILKKNALVTFEEGKRRLQQGAVDQAVALFEKVRIIDPDNIQVLFNLGLIQIQKGALEEGIILLKEAVEKNPRFFGAHLFLGEAYEKQGRISDAILQYRKILSEVPNPQQNEAVLARKKLSQTGETPEIGKIVQSLLQEGARLLALGDLDGAKAEFLVVLTFLPKQVLVHYHLGIIDVQQRAPLEAEKKFRTAIEIDANHFPSYYALGELYEERKDNASAIEVYENLVRVRPADYRAKIRLAILLEKENQIEKALILYHQVVDSSDHKNTPAEELAQGRIDLYEKKLKLSLTDTAISYDSNSTQSEQAESEVTSSMTVAATYFFKKLERYRIPLKFNLNTRFLHRAQIYFLNTGLSLSYARSFSNYNVLADYNLSLGGMFGNEVENGKSFTSQVYTGEVSRQGKFPSAVTLRGSFQDLEVSSNPVFNSKRSTGTGILTQHLSVWETDLGSLHLTYRYIDNAIEANDQARREDALSVDYSRKIGAKTTLRLGFSQTEQNFLNEDTLALSQGERKKRHNTLTSATLGFSYALKKGVTLFANFTKIDNKSNLPVPADLSVQDINNGQVTSLGTYDQNLITFGMTGTADLKTFYPQWHRLGKQLTVGLTTGYYRPSLKELNTILADSQTVIVQDPNHLLPTNPGFRSEVRNIQMAEIKGSTTLGVEMEWEMSANHGLVFSVSEWRNSTVRTDIVPMLLSPGEPAIQVPRSARYNLTINQLFLSWRYSFINNPSKGRLFLDLGLLGGAFTNLTADALVKVEQNPVGDPFASLGSFEARGRSFTTRVGLGGAIFIRPWLSLGLSANYVWGTVTKLKVARDFPSSFGLISEGLPGVSNSDCNPRLGDRTGGEILTTTVCQQDQVVDNTQAPRVLKLKLNGVEGRAALRFHFGKGKPGRTAFERFMNWGDPEEVAGGRRIWQTLGSWAGKEKQPGDAGLSLDGTLKNETAYRVNKPVTFTKALTLMRLNAQYAYSSKFAVTGRGRAFYDAITDFVDLDTISPRRFENTILTQLPRNPSPEEIAAVDAQNSRGVETNKEGVELRELYLDAQFKHFDLRIGKQIVRWGVVPGSRVTDEINPFDFGEFILREVEDRFIPLMMVKADFFPGDARFELIWITEAVPHKPAPAGSEFEQFQILDGFVPPDSFLDSSLNFDAEAIENTEIAGRLVQNLRGWEIGFTGFYTWDDFPASFRRIEGDSIGGFSSAPEVVFTPRMNRITTVGTTLSKSFGRIVLNAEFAYTFGKLFGTLLNIEAAAASTITSTDGTATDIAPTLGELERDFMKYAAGLDFALLGSEMSVQFLQQYIPDWDPAILQDEIDTVLSHFMRKTFMNERLVGKMLTLFFLNEDDLLLRPALEARLTDKVKTVVGADFFIGDRGEEVGQFDFIGFFKDSSRVYVELAYSF